MNIAFVSKAAEREFNELPKGIREDFAKNLEDVLNGRPPSLPITHLTTDVGKGAIELKINGSPAFRTIYVAKYNNTLYILHSFSKTTNGVDRQAMKLAKSRYKKIPR